MTQEINLSPVIEKLRKGVCRRVTEGRPAVVVDIEETEHFMRSVADILTALSTAPVAETAGEAVDEGVARERIEKIIKANVRSYGRGGALTFIGVENAAKVILAAYPSPPVPELRTALMDARHWHDARRDDLGKQPPSGDRDWRRMEHADEIARIDAALKSEGK